MKRLLIVVASLVPWWWFLDARADSEPSGASWVILDAAGKHTMSGSMEDIDAARAQQRSGEPLVYALKE